MSAALPLFDPDQTHDLLWCQITGHISAALGDLGAGKSPKND